MLKKVFIIMFGLISIDSISQESKSVKNIKKLAQIRNSTPNKKISLDIADSFTYRFETTYKPIGTYFVEVKLTNLINFLSSNVNLNDSIYFHLVSINDKIGLHCHAWNNNYTNSSDTYFTFFNGNVNQIPQSQFCDAKRKFVANIKPIIDQISVNQTKYNFSSMSDLKSYIDTCQKYNIEFIQIWFGVLYLGDTSKYPFNSLTTSQINFINNNLNKITTVMYGVRKSGPFNLFGINYYENMNREFNDPCPTSCNSNYPYHLISSCDNNLKK